MTPWLLRVAAVGIAMAGLVDPAITWSGAARPRVAIVVESSSPGAAQGVRHRLVRDLGATYEVTSEITSDAAAVIVIGDRYPDRPVPESLLVATVTTRDRPASSIRIVSVDAPPEVPAGTTIHVEVEVDGVGAAGRDSQVTLRTAGLEAGRAAHRWSASPERWRPSFDVVPVGDPPFVVRVEAGAPVAETPVMSGFPSSGLGTGSRTVAVADVVVDLRRTPLRVQIYEPRPSWATTFVRRALERDPRFEVASLSYSSRNISSQTEGEVTLSDPRLDAFDLVVVGGLDRLTATDARSLDRYMRERGGAVALLPDQRIGSGAARDLVGSIDLAERLLERPSKLSVSAPARAIEASELLVMRTMPAGVQAIARTTDDEAAAVIVSMPHGDGRLLVSGAMDAWRFRAADDGAFDRFWQSTLAGLALASPPPVEIRLVPQILQPNEPGEVVVRVRSHVGAPVSASIDNQPIRLRPDPGTGVFRGMFTAGSMAGRSQVTVQVAGVRPLGPPSAAAALGTPLAGARTLRVQPDVRRVGRDTPALSMLASSHRGMDVTPNHLEDVEQFLRRTVSPPAARVTRHPMRSLWGIVPFAACLSGEWWLRRRRGLR